MSLSDQLWCPTSVQVTVLQARGLRIKGKSGTNDAYAVMQVAKEKYQTSVAEKSVAPVWKEEATFDLPQGAGGGGGGGSTDRSTLHVHVLHRALVGPDKLLGQAVINLLQLSEDKTRNKSEWFKLLDKTGKADKDRGEVFVDIQFMRNNMTASMFDLSGAGKSRSRLGKFKDKVRGKKKESDTASTIVQPLTQVLTDSEEEGNDDVEVAAGKEEKKKKKIKSLFSTKSNLQRNMSQSMSVLPAKNSTLSGSQSSGLNVDSSEGKKKFKFMMHKRSGSSDSKDSSSVHQKHGAAEQSNLCINGSHIYCEEPQSRTSRIGSNFSLASSGHGSMEDVPESSPPSVDSLRAVRQYSPWTEEEEETAEVESIKEDVSELREEEERIRMEEENRRKEEEMVRRREEEEEAARLAQEKRRLEEEQRRQREEEERAQEERRRQEEERKLAEEKRRLEEAERRRIEEEKIRKEEEERIRREEEERRRREEEERAKREEEERERLAEEKRRLQEQERRRIEEEEKRQREEEERIRMEEERAQEQRRRQEEEERAQEQRRRQEEEERARRQEEERKLEEEKRRLEEERRIEEENTRKEEEERIRREEERRRQEEEEMMRRQEEHEEMRRLEEQERRQREEEERIKQEEEKARREKEEYEALLEEKRKLEEEERKRLEAEEKIRKEEEARIRVEEEQRRKEEEERVKREEEEELKRLAEEKMKLEEQERRRIEEERQREEMIRKEEERRKEEEERARKEKEEYERLDEEKMRQEEQERRRLEEEERIRKEEQERIRMEEEKRRREEEEKRIIEEEEKMKREEEERIRKEEEARKLEEVKRDAEEQKKRENQTQTKSTVESQAEVTSTNPFDENFSSNPFDEIPNSPAANVSTVQQRSQSAVPLLEGKASADEKDLISTQREKRLAPQPPGKTQAERQSQREQDGNTRHLAQINKQSKDKDVKTVSVHPQRSVQMIAPLSRSPTDAKNTKSLTESSTTKGTTNVAKNSKRPAPSKPRSVEEGPSSKPKTALSSGGKMSNERGSKTKQEPVVYGLNPFEDDEDENELTAKDDSKTNTGSVQMPQDADKDATSQAKIKSSKMAPAPPLPANKASSGTVPDNSITQPCDLEHAQKTRAATAQSSVEKAGGKKDGPPVTSRRLQPVKPLNPLGQQSASVVRGETDNKSTEILGEVQEDRKVNNTELKGPYSQLTREELISLVLKQENQMTDRDKKISQLEQYIDNLLVRVMEEKPSILMSLNSLK